MDLLVAQPPVNHSLTLKPLDYKNNGSHATVINLLSNRTLMSLKRPVYAGSQIFFITQTPLRTAFHDTQRLLLEAYSSNICSDSVLFAPLMKK